MARDCCNVICGAPTTSQGYGIDWTRKEMHITRGCTTIPRYFNTDFTNCANKKWLNLLELFDLKQKVTSPTRVTKNSVSLIDHVYSSKPETISDCFVPRYSISDHFPVCITKKINVKVKKSSTLPQLIDALRDSMKKYFCPICQMNLTILR